MQTLPAISPDEEEPSELATAGGFSLHARIAVKARQSDKVRSRSDREGALGYKLEPLDFIARLAALRQLRAVAALTLARLIAMSFPTFFRHRSCIVMLRPTHCATSAVFGLR